MIYQVLISSIPLCQIGGKLLTWVISRSDWAEGRVAFEVPYETRWEDGMTPGDRASCLGTSSPHALSQRLLEYSRSKDFKQVLTGLSSLVSALSESDLRKFVVCDGW